MPVDVSVAASFRAMSPDLPTPETMTRPGASASRRTARAKRSSSRAARRAHRRGLELHDPAPERDQAGGVKRHWPPAP